MADKKTQLMAQFYEQCQEKGYTDMHDTTQSLKAKVIATDLKLNYGDIVAFYEKAKQAYSQVQAEQEEEARQQQIKKQRDAEEAKRRAVSGTLLAEISDLFDLNNPKATVLRVYIRPDKTIYTTVNGSGNKIEGIPGLCVQNGEYALFKYHPSKAVYTGATVGGITTGGVHYTQDGYTFSSTKTGNADVQVSLGSHKFNASVVVLSELTRKAFRRDPEFLALEHKGRIACRKGVDVSDTLRAGLSSGDYSTQMYAISKAADEQRFDSKKCARIVSLVGRIINGIFPPTDEEIYAVAERLAQGTTSDQLKKAVETFKSISDYKDASLRARELHKKYEELLQAEKEAAILAREKSAKRTKLLLAILVPVVAIVIAAIIIFTTIVIPNNHYKTAIAELEAGNYAEAVRSFELCSKYKDSADLLLEAQYLYAVDAINWLNYTEADRILSELGDYKDSQQLKENIAFATAQIGETFTLGSYNGKDIVWRVLAVEGDKKLVLSISGVCRKAFDEKKRDWDEDVNWKNCTLRQWLNSEFFKEAFNNVPQSKNILETIITTQNFGGGSYQTTDKIFLLSDDEVIKWLPKEERGGYDWPWWLRSLGGTEYLIMHGIIKDGELGQSHSEQEPWDVRPAMWIDLTGIK